MLVWVVGDGLYYFGILDVVSNFPRWQRCATLVGRIAYDVWLGSLAFLLLIWLTERPSSSAPPSSSDPN